MLEPSFTSTNASVFCLRTVLTHPLMETGSSETSASTVFTRRGDGVIVLTSVASAASVLDMRIWNKDDLMLLLENDDITGDAPEGFRVAHLLLIVESDLEPVDDDPERANADTLVCLEASVTAARHAREAILFDQLGLFLAMSDI
mmetsp:Transcript_39340/g.94219  ORF Transcript_39340/g.94219 Transcript_39340/m.94219 type:complete len:145 (+) Transcript_39340:265-699(+)